MPRFILFGLFIKYEQIRNIPPEWRKLFQAAGVKKGDLRDPETAKFVMNVIGETMLGPGVPGGDQAAPSAPPMPPPSGGGAPPPPPPPPPPMAKPDHGPPPPPQGRPANKPPPAQPDNRNQLLASIRSGTELKKVDPNEPRGSLPDINSLNGEQSKNLVDTLAMAMNSRRMAIQREEDEEEEEDEEWSD